MSQYVYCAATSNVYCAAAFLKRMERKKPQTILKFQEKQACCIIIFWTQNCYFMLQNHKTKNQLVFLTMSTSFVTLFWIEFFTNFFTNKNKSYKSVIFNSENSGFIVSKLVVGSAEQDMYLLLCKLSLRVYLFWSFTSNCRVWFTGWCFFLPNSINGKGYFSNHHQCRSAVAQCTKLRFDKNIVRYSTVSEMSFYSLQLNTIKKCQWV